MTGVKSELKSQRDEHDADIIDATAKLEYAKPPSYEEQAEAAQNKFNTAVDNKSALVTMIDTFDLDDKNVSYDYVINTPKGKVNFMTWDEGYVGLTTGTSSSYANQDSYLQYLEPPTVTQKADGSWYLNVSGRAGKFSYSSSDVALSTWQNSVKKKSQDYVVMQTISQYIEQNKNNMPEQEYQQCQQNLKSNFNNCIKYLNDYGVAVDPKSGELTCMSSLTSQNDLALNMIQRKQRE